MIIVWHLSYVRLRLSGRRVLSVEHKMKQLNKLRIEKEYRNRTTLIHSKTHFYNVVFGLVCTWCTCLFQFHRDGRDENVPGAIQN